jgi:hypothetical protein
MSSVTGKRLNERNHVPAGTPFESFFGNTNHVPAGTLFASISSGPKLCSGRNTFHGIYFLRVIEGPRSSVPVGT